jgi:hypothetical protein
MTSSVSSAASADQEPQAAFACTALVRELLTGMVRYMYRILKAWLSCRKADLVIVFVLLNGL